MRKVYKINRDKYFQRGVSSEDIEKIIDSGIPITKFRNLSKKDLVEKFQLSPEIVDRVKKKVNRTPYDPTMLKELIFKSRNTCCVCRGKKSNAIQIHHIDEHAKGGDNDPQNLAVICPACHELTMKGTGVTQRLKKDQILDFKKKWEEVVAIEDVKQANKIVQIDQFDYLNLPRIIELANRVKHKYPWGPTDQNLNEIFNLWKNTPIPDQIFNLDPKTHGMISFQFHELLEALQLEINFIDLNDYWDHKDDFSSYKFPSTFIFFEGMLLGKMPKRPISKDSPTVSAYHRDHHQLIELSLELDPNYFFSNTALSRISERNEYRLFGKIIGHQEREHNKKLFFQLKIQPFFIGTAPNFMSVRSPLPF